MKNVIIVSPYFAPSAIAGVHRARHLGNHLPAFGWNPIVLCVDEAHSTMKVDPELNDLVSSDLEIIKTSALPRGIARVPPFGDVSLRAWNPLRRELFGLLQQRQIDAVLITGSPYLPMLLAVPLKQRFGVPVVLDFQDPWVSAWGAEQPRWSKAGISHRLAVALEPKVLRATDFVTSVSEIQNEEMAARYPWLDRARMAAIPIGGDPGDFDKARGAPDLAITDGLEDGIRTLVSVGAYWPKAEKVVTALFHGLRHLRERRPDLAAKLRLVFVGTSANPSMDHLPQTLPLAERVGVDDLVREFPARVPLKTALQLMSTADGLFLFGSDEPHYTASKIYSLLMSRRPYLSLFHAESSAHRVLAAAGGGIALPFADGHALDGMAPMIAESIARLILAPEGIDPASLEVIRLFLADAIAEQYAGIFETAMCRRKYNDP